MQFLDDVMSFLCLEDCTTGRVHLVSKCFRLSVLRRILDAEGDERANVVRLPLSLGACLRIEKIKSCLDPESKCASTWQQYGYYDRMIRDLQRFYERLNVCSDDPVIASVKRGEIDLTRPNLIDLSGIVSLWPAFSKWCVIESTQSAFMCSRFRCGDDDVLIQMKDLFEYSASHRDDVPIYVFDRDFAKRYPAMRSDYDSNAVIRALHLGENLYRCFDDDVRPPCRWFLAGPRGSGTDVHRDPRGTCAWNVLLRGKKLWALLHPSLSSEAVGEGKNPDDMPSSKWFLDVLVPLWHTHRSTGKVYVFLQSPGHCIFVPDGWYHCVWNTGTLNVAVTENVITSHSLRDLALRCSNEVKSCGDLWKRFVKETERYYGLIDETHARKWLQNVSRCLGIEAIRKLGFPEFFEREAHANEAPGCFM